MKNLLIFLFCLLAVNVSAQVVKFSDELLSQYDNKKQDSILERSIDLDVIYTPFNFPQGNVSNKEFSIKLESEYNYIGYHLYVPKSEEDVYVLSFNSAYDTVALDVMPEGVYEVVGMIITDEEAEDLRKLIRDTLIICKENSITYRYANEYDVRVYKGRENESSSEFTYRDFLNTYCDEHIKTIGSVAEINRAIHNGNGEWIEKEKTTLILKGEDNHLYYRKMKEVYEQRYWNARHEPYIRVWDLQKAFVVEQYEYMKDYLLKNEFLIQSYKQEFTIETDKGLEYQFPDTIGFKICNLVVKEDDPEFIAIMKIGPDSILYYGATYWENNLWYENPDTSDDYPVYSDTVNYLRINFGGFGARYGYGDGYFSIVRKRDLERIKQAKIDYANRLKVRNTNLEAARIAEQKRNERIKAERDAKRIAEQQEWERKRQTEKQSLISKYGAKFGALVFEHKVTLGMTKEMCQKAWGKPRNKIIRRVQSGTQEVWSYGVSQYLVFDNGVLVECASRS